MRDLRRAVLPVMCAIIVLTGAFRAARPLPTELSDTEFWQLITDASEPGGGFISENLVSNELGMRGGIWLWRERGTGSMDIFRRL